MEYGDNFLVYLIKSIPSPQTAQRAQHCDDAGHRGLLRHLPEVAAPAASVGPPVTLWRRPPALARLIRQRGGQQEVCRHVTCLFKQYSDKYTQCSCWLRKLFIQRCIMRVIHPSRVLEPRGFSCSRSRIRSRSRNRGRTFYRLQLTFDLSPDLSPFHYQDSQKIV